MNRLLTLLFVSSVFWTTGVYAQNVGVGTSSPDNSAKLDVSATDGGLLIPRMTEVQRDAISSPATGLMIFQTDGTVGFYYYDGAAWTAIGGGSSAGTDDQNISGSGLSGTTLTIGIEGGSSETVDLASLQDGSGALEEITEGSNTGYRIAGRNAANYGDIGNNAVDLSYSDGISTIRGATGAYSTAMGIGTIASGGYSTAMGYFTTASADYSTAMGYGTDATDNYSIAMVANTTASGPGSLAMGYGTEASGRHSFAIGEGTLAAADWSIALGDYTHASGVASIAGGYNTNASGPQSFAMGQNTTASGSRSFAMGQNTTASGSRSTAMGYGTDASGNYSTAMGGGTTASGNYSTAMGDNTTASGAKSTSMGLGTAAPSARETAIGSYNTTYTPAGATSWDASDRLFVIGNGSSASAKSDAMIVYKNGNTIINGALTLGSITLPNTDGTSGQVLATNGTGDVSWVTASTGTDDQNISGSSLSGTTLTIGIEGGSSETIDLASLQDGSGALEEISEGSYTGYRISGRDAAYYGDIGSNAVDLSYSNYSSTTLGATGFRSIAMGNQTTASGFIGTAMGNITTASGGSSTAMGYNTTASGDVSTAMGDNTTAKSYAELAIGRFNTDYTPASNSSWQSGDRLFVIGNGSVAGASDAMIVYKNGNTDFYGSVGLNDGQLRLRDADDGNHWLAYHGGGGFDGAKLYGNQTLALQTSNMEVVLRDGRMGVGTASPTNGRLHVSGNTAYNSGGGNYFDQGFGNGAGTNDYGPFTFNVSIYSENDLVVSGKIAAESDARIKDIQGISNASNDLTTLMDIEITDYLLKDKVRFGDQQFKKVIAQQIEEVFPQAVNTMTNFIPNVYATAMVENGMVSLEGDIEVGDKLKVFTKEGEERVLQVQAMEGTSYVLEGEYTGEVFVYGKQVDDFRGVDYDALSMLNISATQALYQRLVELEETNSQFQVQIDRIKAHVGLEEVSTASK